MKRDAKASILATAKIHQARLLYALNQLAAILPLTADKVKNLTDQELLLLELMTSRFAKLQDLLGNKVVDIFLASVAESTENLTMIDKINKLEKFNLIRDADLWLEMRQLRNHLAHEYPDQPGLIAEYLNETSVLSQVLIECLNNICSAIDAREKS